MTDPLLNHFENQWTFVRRLTLDLLDSFTDDELVRIPAPHVGPWWKQFRHIGRVQENYLDALETGSVVFSTDQGRYTGGASRADLIAYLGALDVRLQAILKTPSSEPIDWFGQQKTLGEHLLYLADHEVIHHGQWIAFSTQLGRPFPSSWNVWGV